MTTSTGMELPALVELRQYTLVPGRRDALIDLFDAELAAPQEQVGMRLLGQFRDLDDPDRFVWLRGFPTMAERERALGAFYGGPVWAAHRDAANVTMLDSDDVLLLRRLLHPAAPTALPHLATGSLVTATIYPLAAPVSDDARALLAVTAEDAFAAAGAPAAALLETEPATNTFPALPVREGEHVLVRIASFADEPRRARALAAIQRSKGWSTIAEELRQLQSAPAYELRLQPTAGSRWP